MRKNLYLILFVFYSVVLSSCGGGGGAGSRGDGDGAGSSDTGMSGAGSNRNPQAVVGEDIFSVPLNETVELHGDGSSDPDKDPITYNWTILSTPAESKSLLVNTDQPIAKFAPDSSGEYKFRLLVADGNGGSSQADILISTCTKECSSQSDTSSECYQRCDSGVPYPPPVVQYQFPEADDTFPTSRDPWQWPFSFDSIWNMPIGNSAEYIPASFQDADGLVIDEEYFIQLHDEDPIRNIYAPLTEQWDIRWPGDQNNLQGTMRVPDDFRVMDSSSNACSSFLMPDGKTIIQLEPTSREVAGSYIVGWLYNGIQPISGNGIGGTHYGSGLSAMGGSIRKGELIGDAPIRHALKIEVWGKKYLYYDQNTRKGYRWPADRNDANATNLNHADYYGGTNPSLMQGSLLAIPPGITIESLGIQTSIAKKIFNALQNYGAYIVDNSAWNGYGLVMEFGSKNEVMQKFGIDMNADKGAAPGTESWKYFNDMINIIKNLHVIANNTATSIGGEGLRRQPRAPPFN